MMSRQGRGIVCMGGGLTRVSKLTTSKLTNNRNWSLISMDRKQAYSHTYNTQFHIRVVYKVFITLNALQNDGWDVGYNLSVHETSRVVASSRSRIDSDLEAFSHYPADGSFGALAVQPTP